MVFVALLLSIGLRRVVKVFFTGEIATVLKSRSRSKSIHSGDFEVRTGKSELAQADDMLPEVETHPRRLTTEARPE